MYFLMTQLKPKVDMVICMTCTYTRIFMCEVWKYVFILLFYLEIHATFLCVVVDEK